MKSITRIVSAIAFTGTLFASASAMAAPVSVAHMAYRGQLPGIPGYQRLELGLNSRNISLDDIIEAAGKEPTPQMRSQLRNSLRTVVDFN